MTPPAAAHSREIDGLRAVAVLAVVLYHAGAVLAPGGYVGVDVFFVISGYLITGLLLQEWQARGRIDFAGFYARRARRLLPALFVVVMVTAVAGALLLPPLDVVQDGLARSALAALAFVANFHFGFATGGYFDGVAAEKPLLHLWSLAVEEQYYLVLPLLLLALLRLPRAWVARALVGLSLGSLLLAEFWVMWQPSLAFHMMPARFWELSAGGLVALTAPTAGLAPHRRGWLAAAGLAVILASAFAWPPGLHFPGVGAIPAVAGATAIVLAAQGGPVPGPAGRLLASAPMVRIGQWSYSLYLWHWPLLAFDRALGHADSPLSFRLGLCAIATLLAWATHRWIETPFRLRRDRSRRTLAVAMGSSVAVALLAGGVLRHVGDRDGPAAALAEATRSDRPADMDRCHFGPQETITALKPASCWSDPAKVPGVVIWGDSHARAWQPFAALNAEATGSAPVAQTLDGCPAVAGWRGEWAAWPRHAENCRKLNALALRDVLASPAGTVVLAARWPAYFGTSAPVQGAAAQEPPPMPPAAFASGLESVVAELSRAGKRVLLIAPLPQLRHGAPECIASGRVDKCAQPRADYDASAARPRALLARLAATYPRVQVVETADYFCGPDACPAMRGGRGLYWDDDHVASSAARDFAVRWLAGRTMTSPGDDDDVAPHP